MKLLSNTYLLHVVERGGTYCSIGGVPGSRCVCDSRDSLVCTAITIFLDALTKLPRRLRVGKTKTL